MRPASGRHRRRTLGLLEKCMPDLGCFRSGGNWFHLLYRPVSLLPDDRHLVNTTFLLFTRENPVIQEFLQPNVEHLLRRTVFQPHRPTKIIVHGFMDNIIVGKWLFDMKDRFLETMDCNVVVVDWRGGNVLPYSQATANCRVVGAEIAFLVKMIERVLGTSQSSFHCIGHSLGAQICGYAGARLQNLGRISECIPMSGWTPATPTLSTSSTPTPAYPTFSWKASVSTRWSVTWTSTPTTATTSRAARSITSGSLWTKGASLKACAG
ncbi:hypothetical protein V5799_011295 [Amblyomma americanum]|uniref:Lipase domain-containing protein n=1 Tax=Amblyomma americanum TaxID=6943 RepID=A0AAQ4EHR7_AMBAM